MAINKLKKPGLHCVGHVSGLSLQITSSGTRSWILRATVGGKRRDIGLGPFPEVPLSIAKAAAAFKRQQIRDGIDPIVDRRERLAALRAEQSSFITFEEAAKQYIAAHEKGWKNAKHAAQWRATLTTYADPVIGRLHVKDVNLSHILKILEPIWATKSETASRLRGRIESVLNWAKARGYRTGDNPAQWKGNLEALLSARSRIATVKHHAALDWQECPAFLRELKEQGGTAAKALEFCILTASRSGEVRGARWLEIDLERGVWTIPANRMKARKEHRIPLTATALTLLNSTTSKDSNGIIFASPKGKVFSDMALTMLLRRMGKEFTVHGFRSSFRDWAGENTAFPREVIEHALAHQLKDKAEAAYARGDLFKKRALLMKAWSEFLSRPIEKK